MPGFGISAVTLGVTLAVTGVVRSVAMVISPSDAADIALWSEEAAAIKSLESENVHLNVNCHHTHVELQFLHFII